MASYALLILPNANRVYRGVAAGLLRSELAVVDAGLLGCIVTDAGETVIGGVDYVRIETSAPLDERAVRVLSNLSSLYALFGLEGAALRPVELHRVDRFDDDLLTTQRYVGKTNEAFTKLLLNLALAANPASVDRRCHGGRVRLIDPLCGRGTTLNHALTYGLDAYGIDHDKTDFDAYATFLSTWLKDKRVKHKAESSTIRRGRTSAAHRLRVRLGVKDQEQLVDVVHDDTTEALRHFAAGAFDVLVTDLPYGIQHGSQTGGRLARTPGALLAEALPVWTALLRRGGSVALSWNVRTLPRAELVALVTGAGLAVHGADFSFEHRVDRSITRDVLIAVKPQ